jgi:hypothetical protein
MTTKRRLDLCLDLKRRVDEARREGKTALVLDVHEVERLLDVAVPGVHVLGLFTVLSSEDKPS